MHPQQLTGASAQYTATLTNSGNTDVEVGLSGTDPQGALRFTFPTQTPRLAPGESKEVALTVAASQQPLRGLPKSHPFQIMVTDPQGAAPPSELHGSLTVPPKLPGWAIPAATASLIALIAIIALVIFFSNRSSDVDSPETASPAIVTDNSPLAGAMELSPQQEQSFEIIIEQPGLIILQVQWEVTGNGLQISVAASETDQTFIQELASAGLPTTLFDDELLEATGDFEIPISQDYVSHALTVSF
jgi:hypothetical protein